MPGSSGIVPSTLGGPGFLARARGHAQELAEGDLWRRMGYRSEADPLRAVLLVRPSRAAGRITDAKASLMMAPVSCARLDADIQRLAEEYERHGVDVTSVECPDHVSVNAIFARDSFLATPEGAVIGRMASEQRAGEERFVSAELARLGFPIVRTMTGTCLFEGADAQWLGGDAVLVGVGRRTNEAAARVLRETLGAMGLTVESVRLAATVQHLLGAMTFADRDLVFVNGLAATDELCAVLARHGLRAVVLPDREHELSERRAMNFVALGPREVVMPRGAPHTMRLLRDEGVTCHEVDVDECIKAAGGVGCLTGVLLRG